MKTHLLTLILSCLILLSCGSKKNNFKIVGKALGFSDNTILYLRNPEKNVIVDSTYVKNESFSFTGYVEWPSRYVLQTKFTPGENPPYQYKLFWVTDTIITFEATNGDFYFAKVKGGEINRQQIEYDILQYENLKAENNILAAFDTLRDTEKIKDLNSIQDSLWGDRQKKDIQFIREHPDYFLSSALLAFYASTYGKELAVELYTLMSDEMKQSKKGKEIKSYIDLNKEFNIGDKIVDISLPNKNGETENLYSIQSRYILVDFWSSSCGPCRYFNSKMSKDYKSLKDNGLEVFSVSFDTNCKNWLKASEADGISWINLNDKEGEKGKIALTFGINHIPTNYLIDSNKEIIEKDIDFDDLMNILDSNRK